MLGAGGAGGDRAGRTGELSALENRLAGDPGARPLLPVQALHSVGETMFAVSLAGSLFFNVSVDAARPRIILYLALTFAPFVVLGPLIGPFIDRIGGGHRTMLLIALGGRAVAALVLAGQIRSIWFYPAAFVLIVLAKVFAVSRNALVPVLVEQHEHLVLVNSRLARTASIAGAIAAPLAVLLLSLGGGPLVLWGAAIAYGAGAVSTRWLPSVAPRRRPDAVEVVESSELAGPGIRSAAIVMAGMRAAVGFTLFHVGFALKTSGAPTWVFGALAVASGVGTFAGTFVAPRIRPRWPEHTILTVMLVLPLVAGVVAALRFHPVTVGLLGFLLALSASVARRAFDGVVQTEAPHAKRGQAFAGLEMRLELAWVLGALLAVATRSDGWMGLTGLAVGFALLLLDRTVRARNVARLESVAHTDTLAIRLMQTAEALHAQGDSQQAVVVAVAAVESADEIGRSVPPGAAERVRRLAREAVAAEGEERAVPVLTLAQQLVARALDGPPPERGPTGSPIPLPRCAPDELGAAASSERSGPGPGDPSPHR